MAKFEIGDVLTEKYLEPTESSYTEIEILEINDPAYLIKYVVAGTRFSSLLGGIFTNPISQVENEYRLSDYSKKKKQMNKEIDLWLDSK